MDLKVKIKQEPMDYTEHVQSLLANAKSAYRNRFDSDVRREEPDLTNGTKRKSSFETHNFSDGKRTKLSSISGDPDKISAAISSRYETRSSSRAGTGNDRNGIEDKLLPCLLCDEEFTTEDKRMLHVTLVHKSKSNANKRQGMRIARHTCQICFARFRTLRDFFTHTAGHAQDPGLSAIQRDISDKIAKNTLQQFLMSSVTTLGGDVLQPTFKCDCCDTVFTNRDSYAMHVMMRVKDESTNNGNSAKKSNVWSDTSIPYQSGSSSVRKPTENGGSKPDLTATDFNQAYYVDVTSVADKDEYLHSFLQNTQDKDRSREDLLYSPGSKKCSLCSQTFMDQDSLAMHVMSNHAEEIPSPSTNGSAPSEADAKHRKAIPPLMYAHIPTFGRKGPLSVHGELLYCEYCGGIFTSRDSLAMHVLTHTATEIKSGVAVPKIRTNDVIYKSKMFAALSEQHNIRMSNGQLQLGWLKSHRINEAQLLDPEHGAKETTGEGKDNSVSSTHIEKIVGPVKENQPSKNQNEKDDTTVYGKTEPEQENDATDTGNQRRFIYRSLSLPDLGKTETAILPRPQSANNVPEKYVYLLNEPLLEYENDSTPTDVDARKPEIERTKEMREPTRNLTPTQSIAAERSLTSSDEISDPSQLIHYLNRPVYVCKFCEIIFMNRTLYYLHKGLHNVNNPWQCNMCGKVCANVHDFSAHVIHL